MGDYSTSPRRAIDEGPIIEHMAETFVVVSPLISQQSLVDPMDRDATPSLSLLALDGSEETRTRWG